MALGGVYDSFGGFSRCDLSAWLKEENAGTGTEEPGFGSPGTVPAWLNVNRSAGGRVLRKELRGFKNNATFSLQKPEGDVL